MRTVAAFEVKKNFSRLLTQVEKREEIIITKHGHAAAKIIPIQNTNGITRAEAIKRLLVFGQANRLNGLNWKTLRDEGRR